MINPKYSTSPPRFSSFFFVFLKDAIVIYTGLSPATFFTLLALLFAAYHVLFGLFRPSETHNRPRSLEEMQLLPPPVQLGEITAEELKQYDGSDPKKPLIMAVKSQIYDVSQSRSGSWNLLIYDGNGIGG
ncbi:membrane steroid-binding protein 2-like [Rosa rugosa]|uniref:membrane steroid-binding protein 2-like n=1 Tax=Rosa rugosa TaxID=74645 RepID=UPI002B406C5D|nr:membrane steroid-binding protein 2-like [Rosa rugosa]